MGWGPSLSRGSVYQPRSNEPFRVGVKLGAGRSVTFESGYDANSRVLTRQYIYNNDVGSKEGARVSTSVGRFTDRCGQWIRRAGVLRGSGFLVFDAKIAGTTVRTKP